MFVQKLYNVKTTFIDIKMDISLFKIRRASLPNLCVWMKFFNRIPNSKTNTLCLYAIFNI